MPVSLLIGYQFYYFFRRVEDVQELIDVTENQTEMQYKQKSPTYKY